MVTGEPDAEAPASVARSTSCATSNNIRSARQCLFVREASNAFNADTTALSMLRFQGSKTMTADESARARADAHFKIANGGKTASASRQISDERLKAKADREKSARLKAMRLARDAGDGYDEK